MRKRPTLVAVLTTLMALAAACSDSDVDDPDDAGSRTSTTAARSSTTSTSVLDVPAVSFTADASPTDLGGGWSVAGCEGDAPLLCITKDGQAVGRVELAVFPVASFALPGFQDAAQNGDVTAAMEIVAEDFVRTFIADRKDGCGADYEIEATDTEPATVLGREGLRYGYVGRQDGKVVERQLNHGTIDGADVLLANASAYAPDSCVPPEGEFTPETLEAFAPRLRALVATASR